MELDKTFRERHKRLVAVTRAIFEPSSDGDARREHDDRLREFAIAVAGPDAPPIDPNAGLSAVGPLLADEVLNLHMLLAGETDREKARLRFRVFQG